jgi:anti-sigma factor RsiW
MNAAPSKHPPREFLQAFGLGKLDDVAAAKVGQHLETCPDCKRQVAELSSDSLLENLRKANGPLSTPAPGETLAPSAPVPKPQPAAAPSSVPAELLNNARGRNHPRTKAPAAWGLSTWPRTS